MPEFGHSAPPTPNPYNYVAALLLYGTQGSVRGLNRWQIQEVAIVAKVQCLNNIGSARTRMVRVPPSVQSVSG